MRRRFALTVVGTALLLALSRAPVRAADISVDNGAVAINDNDVCSLIEAIQNANDVKDGNVHDDCTAGQPGRADTITLPVGGSFTLTTPLYGYYASYSDNGLPMITSQITLSGNGATIERDAASLDPFRLLIVGSTGDLTLNQVTFSNGEATNKPYSGPMASGGAIANHGSLTINGSTLHNNRAGSGGGVWNMAELTISNSTISGNIAIYSGGGVSNYDGNTTIIGSTISGNTSISGGGMFNISGAITVTNTTIENNTAASTGGGLSTEAGMATIMNSTISRNRADFLGGGLWNNAGMLTIMNSTISGNMAQQGGGVNNNGQGVATISNSTISGNTAAYGDDRGSGGGLVNIGVTTINRSLISGNTAGYRASEISNDVTIVANNYNLFGHSELDNATAFTGFIPGANDITATSDGTQPVGLAAILDPTLESNGGPTQTHALPAGSPAIDAAPSADCTAEPVNGVDQRGVPRNANGDGMPSPNECDSGAFELQPEEPISFLHFVPIWVK